MFLKISNTYKNENQSLGFIETLHMEEIYYVHVL